MTSMRLKNSENIGNVQKVVKDKIIPMLALVGLSGTGGSAITQYVSPHLDLTNLEAKIDTLRTDFNSKMEKINTNVYNINERLAKVEGKLDGQRK